ncbi:ubinuclein-1-like isoform X2 [Vicia villosa]|uniref:ubinuclein-1-like isoform X2 n=1 Tax=Vicia villosa TaxID=3911 RepID=UPI00273C68FF|nr:ubinuclein-1-like isoform X2 [Vicia villosa]
MTEEKKPSSSFVKIGDRQLFTVELRPGETTIVSWKKLLKDAAKSNGSASTSQQSRPEAVPGQPAEIEENDEAQPHRFSAVIEKIERLYMGKDSSDDEDLPDVPDDDQYDTEDSFIDDAELDEYFQVDHSKVKHDGFFVNRGKLERTDEPPVIPNQQPKKRRRKDIVKNPGENNNDHGSNKHVKVGKAASGKTTFVQARNVPDEHYDDLKIHNHSDIYGVSSKKKIADTKPISVSAVSLKTSSDDVPAAMSEAKDADKKKIGTLQSKNTSESFDASHQKYHEKGAYVQSKSQPGRGSKSIDNLENNSRVKEKNGMRQLPDLNLTVGKWATKAAKSEYMHRKDGSSVRPKSSMLEKTLVELEKMVAESRPPAADVEADNTSQAVKRRLPREIKLKLAKVARIAVLAVYIYIIFLKGFELYKINCMFLLQQASHGKVSKELINRLMSILGHLMQLRTLKRNLKIMINMGLSAKQDDDDRFQRIKKEVVDMIKIQAPASESKQQQKAGASGDVQEFGPDGKAITKRSLSMDAALEDKICDLYDIFVDGLDENAGPQIRKLYAELAELWPTGYMDNHGIKRGICRAKERRRASYTKNKEKIKTKKLLASRQEDSVQLDTGSITSQQNQQEKLAPELTSHAFTSTNKPISNTSTVQVPIHMNGVKPEKAKGSSSSSLDDVRVADGILTKKLKRKPELEFEGANGGPERLVSLQGEERPRPQKPSSGVPTKSNVQPTSLPGLELSS